MTQLTLTFDDRELDSTLRQTAETAGLSLTEAALLLLRRGARLVGKSEGPIGDTLDQYAGTMSEEEYEELGESLKSFDQIDESLWK